MDTKTLEKVKSLLANSREFATFWARFKGQCREPKCDKHSASFNSDGRFSSFEAKLSFDNCIGFYGSSSCSTFMSCTREIAQHYLVRAVNVHNETLFQTMAELMKADAVALTDKAREEIEAMSKMLAEIDPPESAEAA